MYAVLVQNTTSWFAAYFGLANVHSKDKVTNIGRECPYLNSLDLVLDAHSNEQTIPDSAGANQKEMYTSSGDILSKLIVSNWFSSELTLQSRLQASTVDDRWRWNHRILQLSRVGKNLILLNNDCQTLIFSLFFSFLSLFSYNFYTKYYACLHD